MSLRSAKYANKQSETHVKESNRDHEWNHGNQRIETTHPPDGMTAHAGLADVGGVIGPRTRDTDYTRFTGGSLNVERLKTATAAATNESTKRFCIIDSGAGTSTGPAPSGTEKGCGAQPRLSTAPMWYGLPKTKGCECKRHRAKQSEQPYRPNGSLHGMCKEAG